MRSWTETTMALPVGGRVRAKVLTEMPFGVFVEIEGHPDAVGLMEITTIPQVGELPAVGRCFDAVVLGHAIHNFQVRLAPAGGWLPSRSD